MNEALILDEGYQYWSEADLNVEEYLLKGQYKHIKNYKNDHFISNFFQCDEEVVEIEGKIMRLANRGIYMVYEPSKGGNPPCYSLYSAKDIVERYKNPDKYFSWDIHFIRRWIEEEKKGRVIVNDVFNAVVEGLKVYPGALKEAAKTSDMYFLIMAFNDDTEKYPHRKGYENIPSYLANYNLNINKAMVLQSGIYDAIKFENERDALKFMAKAQEIMGDWSFEITTVGKRVFGKEGHRYVYNNVNEKNRF